MLFRPLLKHSCLTVYLLAIGLFTVCNLMGMMLIRTDWADGHKPRDSASSISPASGTPVVRHHISFLGRPQISVASLLARTTYSFNRTTGRHDAKGTYVIHDFVVTGDEWASSSAKSLVTLATQTSVDRLQSLLEVSLSWTAPASVAIYVPGIDTYIAKIYIAFLRHCFDTIRANASFHFAYHRDMGPVEPAQQRPLSVAGCDRASDVLPSLLRLRPASFKKWWQQSLYPQNHLRNVARQGCVTPYHLLTDVDIVPVSGMADELQRFLVTAPRQHCPKCAYVIPTYEIDEKLQIPRSKSELLSRVRSKQSRPFHAQVFIYNQFATNHSLWEQLDDPGETVAAYKVTNYEFFYEPFYVAEGNVPPHDERFVGYGFTRNTQVFEMSLAGYQFWVLNPVFAVHRGMQSRRSRGAWREKQNAMNRKHFLRFKHDMLLKYPSAAGQLTSSKKQPIRSVQFRSPNRNRAT